MPASLTLLQHPKGSSPLPLPAAAPVGPPDRSLSPWTSSCPGLNVPPFSQSKRAEPQPHSNQYYHNYCFTIPYKVLDCKGQPRIFLKKQRKFFSPQDISPLSCLFFQAAARPILACLRRSFLSQSGRCVVSLHGPPSRRTVGKLPRRLTNMAHIL